MSLRFSTLAAAALLALASSSASAAYFSANVNATSGTLQSSGPTMDISDSGALPISLNAASTATGVTPPGFSSGSSTANSASYAAATAGALHLMASSDASMVSVNGGGVIAGGASSATAYLNDSFIINALNCGNASLCGAGAVGAFTFSIAISGPVGGSGSYTTSTPGGGNGGWSGNAEWNNSGSVGAGYVPGNTYPSSADWFRGRAISASERGLDYDNTQGSGAGIETYTISFVFGQAISFSMQGQAYSSATSRFDFYASQPGGSSGNTQWAADLSHTMAWGGIQELRDAGGHLLTDYAALSADSGFDYRNAYTASAVPEPTSAGLMAAGVVGLGMWMRRRRAAVQA